MAPCARDTQPVLTSQWASVRRWTGHRANKAGPVFEATVLAGQLAFRREGRGEFSKEPYDWKSKHYSSASNVASWDSGRSGQSVSRLLPPFRVNWADWEEIQSKLKR